MSKRRIPPGDRTVAVAYVRASTTEQHLSPDAQRSALETWATHNGARVAAWFVERGVSGGSDLDNRPALAEALGALRSHGAGILVVARRDRLARDAEIAVTIDRAVRMAGAVVVSADGVGNGEAPSDTFSRRVHDAVAEYERALIRLRTKAALAAKRAKGERTGGVPFGYALAIDGKHLVADEKEKATIAAVFALRQAGHTIRSIVTECRRRGLVSRRGTPLGKTQVERLLRRAPVTPSEAA